MDKRVEVVVLVRQLKDLIYANFRNLFLKTFELTSVANNFSSTSVILWLN